MTLRKLVVALAGALAVGAAFSESYEWNGGATGLWNSSGNWLPSSGVPAAGDTATFNSAAEITDGIAIGDGTLEIVLNANVTFSGVISDGSAGTGALSVSGSGDLHLRADNTFSGGASVSGGNVYLHSGGGLGVAEAEIDLKSTTRSLTIDGGLTVTTPLKILSTSVNLTGTINISGAGETIFNEAVTATSKIYVNHNGTSPVIRFKKLVKNADYANGKGTMHFEGGIDFGTWHYSWNVEPHYYYAAVNQASVLEIASDNAYVHGVNAMPAAGTYQWKRSNAIVHLDGFDQLLAGFGSMDEGSGVVNYGFETPVGKPARVTMEPRGDVTVTWHGVFSGATSFCWNPANSRKQFIIDGKAQTTSGELVVSNGIVRVKSGGGFTNSSGLSRVEVATGALLDIQEDAIDFKARELVLDGTLTLGGTRTLTCRTAVVNGNPLADRTYRAGDEEVEGFLTGDGSLVVDSVVPNEWIGGTTGDWEDSENWSEGVPSENAAVTIAGAVNVSLQSATPRMNSLLVDSGATLTVSGWTNRINAASVSVKGTITAAGSFSQAYDPAVNPPNRVWIVCDDLHVFTGGAIDVSGCGWAGGSTADAFGPGGPGSSAYGASHGGIGAVALVGSRIGAEYDNPYVPVLPGSGGRQGASGTGAPTAGGGAVRIEATGCVTVDGSVLASGVDSRGQSSASKASCGSGGSIWITCGAFAGTSGAVRAEGGDSDVGAFPSYVVYYQGERTDGGAYAGGGGMVRIEYDPALQAQQNPDVFVSAAGGEHKGILSNGGGAIPVSKRDRFRTDADLGTVTFTDDVLLGQLIGSNLSGRLVGVTNYVHTGDLTWKAGHVRIAGEGASFRVTGSLVLSNDVSRLEVGGVLTRTNGCVIVDRWGGTKFNSLRVDGSLRVVEGAALDIRPAETNSTMAWGGEVVVGGDFVIGDRAFYYPWSDPMNLGSVHAVVGGDFRVLSGGTVDADRRGGGAGYGSAQPFLGYFGVNRVNGYGIGAYNRGASHGGQGGLGYWSYSDALKNYWQQAPDPLADEWTAEFPGAGGGSDAYGEGGPGGGLVRVEAKRAVVIDGLVTANGGISSYNSLGSSSTENGYCSRFGSGAGGGIYIAGATVSGAGTISACGGNGIGGYEGIYGYSSGCGGGGRIVIAVGEDDLVNAGAEKVSVAYCETMSGEGMRGRCSYVGAFAVGGGTNVWNVANKADAPVQFDKAHGGDGTVRFVAFNAPFGMIMLVR